MEKTMEIKQIKVASCREDVVILGQLSRGNFQYESSIVINTSDLNRLINLYKKGIQVMKLAPCLQVLIFMTGPNMF